MPTPRRFVLSLFVAGTVIAGIFLFCRSPEPQVQAQPPAKELSPGPYQISSWAVWATAPPGGMGGLVPNRLFRGAYIIDSKTGDVFSVEDDEKPKLIGSVKKKE